MQYPTRKAHEAMMYILGYIINNEESNPIIYGGWLKTPPGLPVIGFILCERSAPWTSAAAAAAAAAAARVAMAAAASPPSALMAAAASVCPCAMAMSRGVQPAASRRLQLRSQPAAG